jgi:diguanylate cyclase (GGDEF)-like protein
MDKDGAREDGKEIVAGNKQALAQRSSVLVSRALRDLSARDVATFVELAKALTSSLQLDQVLRVIMEKLNELFRVDNWYLLLFDESTQELYFELAVGKESNGVRDRRVKLGEGIAGWVAANSKIVVAVDAQRDPRFRQSVDGWPSLETRSLVGVPLCFQKQCLGVIGLVNFVGSDGFPQSDLSLLQALADFAAIAIENARHIKAIHDLTIKDEFTGLYNARHLAFILDSEIYRCERYGYEFSILFVDLDSLKDLKKSLSYEHFLLVMKELGEAFKHQLRLIDFAFYYGDGEFVLLLPQTLKEAGRVMANRLHKLFKDASWLRSEGKTIRLPARVAVGAFPEDGKTKADLLHAVDEAMYLLKKSATNGVVVANVGIASSL